MGGGALWSEIPERGFLENLDKNLLFEVNCTETCLCITDSLSHPKRNQQERLKCRVPTRPRIPSKITDHLERSWNFLILYFLKNHGKMLCKLEKMGGPQVLDLFLLFWALEECNTLKMSEIDGKGRFNLGLVEKVNFCSNETQ